MRLNGLEISIPQILEVGIGTLDNAGGYLHKAGIGKIAIFFGKGIKERFAMGLVNSIERQENLEVLAEFEDDDINLESITKKAFSIPGGVEAIVGVGGGRVLDVAKYIAFLNDQPFISIPTSTAHDGFASSGCSLYVNGKRTSVRAKMPFGIIVDIGLLKSSPEQFIYSGIGDLISKITAVYDWNFEMKHGRARVNDFAVMIAKKSVNSIARMPYNDIKENFFLKELVDSLTMSGIAMEIAASSAPASGSEHLISHALDKIREKPLLHGIQVGVATYLMSLVQEHRVERIRKFLSETGFFDYVKTVNLTKKEILESIDLAPSIKPNRYTVIHIEENRAKAKKLVFEDRILSEVLS